MGMKPVRVLFDTKYVPSTSLADKLYQLCNTNKLLPDSQLNGVQDFMW